MPFPTLAGKKVCGPINLNDYYAAWARMHFYTCPNPSPALVPKVASRMLADLHKEKEVDWSWGGLYEMRNELWRGSYLASTRSWMHLGVDLNVPAGTPVYADFRGRVALVDHDPSKGGWGTRILIEHAYRDIMMIYAHLAPDVSVIAGDTVLPNQILGAVGLPKYNGGWFPHLHLQALSRFAREYYLHNQVTLQTLDGYGLAKDIEHHRAFFPDPMQYIQIP